MCCTGVGLDEMKVTEEQPGDPNDWECHLMSDNMNGSLLSVWDLTLILIEPGDLND